MSSKQTANVRKKKKTTPKKTGKTTASRRKKDSAAGKKKLGLWVMLALLFAAGAAFFGITRFFLVPFIVALTLVTLFDGLYRWLLDRLKGREIAASFIACLLVLIFIFVPLYIIGHLFVLQSMEFFRSTQQWAQQAMTENPDWFKDLRLEVADWSRSLQGLIGASSRFIAKIVNKTSAGLFQLVLNLFFILYTMFFLFKDGDRLKQRLRYLSPLKNEYEEKLLDRFNSISTATIKGTVVIGLIQGALGSVALLLFGYPTWILWGVIMTVLSIIPLVGSYFVLIPLALYELVSGGVWRAAVLVLVAVVLNYAVDYLLRPRLVGHESKVHDLVIFFSSLGGIYVFGVAGFVVGPVIAVFFLTLLDIYGNEFKGELDT